jgi:LysM repeat protein
MDNLPTHSPPSCPYLGIFDDPKTHFGFATSSNYCYHPDPAEPLELTHQEAYCLTQDYTNCPVYQSTRKGRLPPNIRRVQDKDKLNLPLKNWLLLLVGLGIICVIFLVFVNPFGIIISDQVERIPATTLPYDTPTTSQEGLLSTPSDYPIPTNTPQEDTITPEIKPSSTPILTSTPIPSPGPQFGTPFGSEANFIVYKVKEGESLPLLANRYGTSVDVMRTINGLNPNYSIFQDQVLVIMVGNLDVSTARSLDYVYLEADDTVQDLAFQYGVSVEEMGEYNGLGTGEIIPGERWLIFPKRQVTGTPTLTPVITPDLSRALTGPFGPDNQYILHQAKLGDSISLLEDLYLTSAAVINQANQIDGRIQVDQVLVIVLNQIDPTGIRPFKVIMIDSDISVEDLAAQLDVLASDLCYFNDLEAGDLIPSGHWIIYPAPSQ